MEDILTLPFPELLWRAEPSTNTKLKKPPSVSPCVHIIPSALRTTTRACVHALAHTHTHVHTHTRMHACTHAHTHARTHTDQTALLTQRWLRAFLISIPTALSFGDLEAGLLSVGVSISAGTSSVTAVETVIGGHTLKTKSVKLCSRGQQSS